MKLINSISFIFALLLISCSKPITHLQPADNSVIIDLQNKLNLANEYLKSEQNALLQKEKDSQEQINSLQNKLDEQSSKVIEIIPEEEEVYNKKSMDSLKIEKENEEDSFIKLLTSIQKENTREAFADVDKAVKALPIGKAQFIAPEKMHVGEKKIIELTISLDPSYFQKSTNNNLPEETKIEIDSVHFGCKVEASLQSTSGINAKALNSENIITIDSKSAPTWKWELTALESGPAQIDIDLYTILTPGKNMADSRYRVKTFTKSISIVIFPPTWLFQLMAKNWQWAWGAIIIPIGTITYKKFFKKRKKDKKLK